MRNRLKRAKRHSKRCLAQRKATQKGKSKRCLCGRERHLWMYQPGDLVAVDINGQLVTVSYAWDNFGSTEAMIDAFIQRADDRGAHVHITDSLGPIVSLPAWLPVAKEVKLYIPRAIEGDGETDPLKQGLKGK